ncbi:MAG: hypothetical protein RLP09_26520 [Sandaracinaceae bacterium]
MKLSELVTFSSPLERPLHFLALELAVLACTALVLAHAIARYRAGDRRHLFQWLVITSYGVQMELLAFNFLDNYAHAEFTVQLYGGQLPLYVTGLYGSFLYTGLKVAERMGVHPVAEALLAGFAMFLIDVPFDIAGVALGWWTWMDTDPVLAYRWLGVPVTSYYWYLAFGAVAAGLCRLAWPRLEGRPFAVAAGLALVAGSLVIVFGVLAFLPFHGLHALGLSHGALVALHAAVCVALALLLRGTPTRAHPLIVAVVVVLPGAMIAVMLACALDGALSDPWLRLGASVAALLGLAALLRVLPLRRAASAPSVPVPRAHAEAPAE